MLKSGIPDMIPEKKLLLVIEPLNMHSNRTLLLALKHKIYQLYANVTRKLYTKFRGFRIKFRCNGILIIPLRRRQFFVSERNSRGFQIPGGSRSPLWSPGGSIGPWNPLRSAPGFNNLYGLVLRGLGSNVNIAASELCQVYFLRKNCNTLREDTHKKSGLVSGRTTKVLPSLHQWLSGPCHFFFFFFLVF